MEGLSGSDSYGGEERKKSMAIVKVGNPRTEDFHIFSAIFNFDVVLLFSSIVVAELPLLWPLVIPPSPKQKLNPKISYT